MNPKRSATSTLRLERTARQAGNAAPSYRNIPKQGDHLPCPPDVRKWPPYPARAIHREHPKLYSSSGAASDQCRRQSGRSVRRHRDIPKRYSSTRRTYRKIPKGGDRNRPSPHRNSPPPYQNRPSLRTFPMRWAESEIIPQSIEPPSQRERARVPANTQTFREFPIRPPESRLGPDVIRTRKARISVHISEDADTIGSVRPTMGLITRRMELRTPDISGDPDTIRQETPSIDRRTPSGLRITPDTSGDSNTTTAELPEAS